MKKRYDLARPFTFFEDFDRELDRAFTPVKEWKWRPTARVEEEETHYHLAIDIPGVDKEHLKVELNDNVLSIEGERKDAFKKEGTEFKSYGSFSQRFTIPDNGNADEIEVSHTNGVLDIVIPKTQKEETKRSLEVKSGKSSYLGRLMK